MRVIDSGRRVAPVYGQIVRHLKVEDELRDRNMRQFNEDSAQLSRSWKPRRTELRKKYRNGSFRYFKGLDTGHSKSYDCYLLTIPEGPDAKPKRPSRPHRVKRPSLKRWLGLR